MTSAHGVESMLALEGGHESFQCIFAALLGRLVVGVERANAFGYEYEANDLSRSTGAIAEVDSWILILRPRK